MHSLWLAAMLLAAPPSGTQGSLNLENKANQPSAASASEQADSASAYTALDLRNEIRAAFRQEAATRNKPKLQEEHLSTVLELISLYQILQTNTPMAEAETISMSSQLRSRLHRIAIDLKQDLRRAELAEKKARYRTSTHSPGATYSPDLEKESTHQPALIDLSKSDTNAVTVTPAGLALPVQTVLFQIGVALGVQGGAGDAGEALIEVIKGATGGQKWDDQGGPGSIRLFKGSSLRKSLIQPLRQAGVQALAGALGGQAVDDHGPELVELIETVIAPNTWDKNGGFGSIFYYEPLRVIVVRTTGDVHGNVGNVLGNLRAAGN